MKIFNWVQRKFHHGPLIDGLAQNLKKAELITNEADNKPVVLADVLDGWKDGILTIGTLGFDPFNQKANDYIILEDKEEYQSSLDLDTDDTDDHDYHNYYDYNNGVDEEVNPLMFTTFHDHSFEANAINSEIVMGIDEVSLSPENDHAMKRKGERKTLAELFMADSDMKKKVADSNEFVTNSAKKPVACAKNGTSFAKKLMPHVGEDSRAVKRLQQIMKRMLRRKIHPELEGNKCCKTDNQNKPLAVSEGNDDATESISFLRTLPGPAMPI